MFRCPLCGCVSRERIIDPKRTPEAIEAHIGLYDKIAALERERDELKGENTELKKRLEPIEAYWSGLANRFTEAYAHEAIKKAMELKEEE
jgi:hypothetical protein